MMPELPSDHEISLAQSCYKKMSSLGSTQGDCLTIKISQHDSEEMIDIPVEAFRLLVEILGYMSQGKAVKVESVSQKLFLYQAADILGVSSVFLVGLLQSGKIPYWIEEDVFRVLYKDVLEYKERDDFERLEKLEELGGLD